ncbi:hypothetical protein TEA_029295 [Camellia sinensis var. sinensis]|uniref:Kinesin motor domain-containing protein n=1 Tax=Camellia sinensis var. sinensis TaxID=542762 RepID=A0A4S4ERY2_CAMSN|nr:hypothetical protein TEA_029295 [Camellia sinensis var. sinensis]
MAASSSRGRSSSPFNHRRPSSPHSSSSSSSSFMSTRIVPRSCASSSTSHYGSGNGYSSRSMTPGLPQTDSVYSKGCGGRSPVDFVSADELLAEELDAPRSGGDSISVTIRFRPLSEREYQRGDEIAWYADGDKIVRNEYNLATAYAFDRVFGPSTITEEVYEVAARPVVKAAMEGVNGTVFAYGVTSSGKTHTMHGDQNSPGIIPLAIKDVFSIIQDTPGQEFLLRVSYLEIYNEVINDLLDPTGQNLRVREDAQGTYVEGIKEEVVLSPGHALSFIAAGEEHRHVGSNNFNLFSSRSHTIFTLVCLYSQTKLAFCFVKPNCCQENVTMIESSAHGDEYDGVVFSQLNLIDLAGSESSKTETTGLRRKEGAYINKSLLTLGTVIGKLSEGKASHVPYRDSKLTRLLQSSLSGHGHVSIIDEKSLIKKYQREISSLKLELDQLKKGILVGVSHEEVISLRQQLEEGQVKMQSRLEEEEEAKAALMSRIQRLTKLILVSTKNTIPGCLNDVPSHQRRHSVGEDDGVRITKILAGLIPAMKLDVLRDGSFLIGSENHKEFSSSALAISSDPSNEFKHTRSSNKWNDELSPAGSTVTESTQVGELGGMAMSDQMDLLVEQVKMLGGEIAFSTSTLKRLVEQSVNDPVSSKTQIQNLEHEIQEKRRQMRVLEQRIMESGEASTANGSLIDMQQITSADNRILQEQLQNKCAENKELQEKINLLDQQLASGSGGKSSSSEQCISEEYVDELRKKIKSQEIENEKLKLEHVHILEENSGLHVQNQKLSEEASYAKELASAAAVELKNLAGEVTKLSLHNAKLEKELLAAQEMAHSRGAGLQTGSGVNRKYSDSIRPGRKGRLSGRANEVSRMFYSELDSWDLDPDDLKMELQARKQREAALEAALAEKDFVEEEYRKRAEEAKKRETALENDLANMWVLVAQLKKEGGAIPELSTNERQTDGINRVNDPKIDDVDSKNNVLKERQVTDVRKPAQDVSKEESLVLRLKARLQEMKEKELKYSANGDANSHCVNLVHLLVLSVQFVGQRSQIGFLLSPLDNVAWSGIFIIFFHLFVFSHGIERVAFFY